MSLIDIDQLVSPVSAEEPCGEDLSELTEYYVLENMVKSGEPGMVPGAQAVDPEWRKVLTSGVALLERGKELSVVVHVIHALLRVDGFAGLRDGLELLSRLLAEYWADIYPVLEEDEDSPAEARMNALSALTAGAAGGEESSELVRAVREAPLCVSRQWGQFSWRDMQIAVGETAPPAGMETPRITDIEEAIRQTDSDTMADIIRGIEGGIAQSNQIDQFLTEKLGNQNTAQMTKLAGMLEQILARAQDVLGSSPASEPGSDTTGVASATSRAIATRGFSGTICSQSDVIKALDAVCAYYDANEKSSPVPHLLKRAKRLVGKDFLAIVADIARNARDQVTELFGEEEGSD